MGLPPFEEKPLARVQASPRVKMRPPAPRLPSPQGSRLYAQNGGMAQSPDSPAWVCTPARVPGHDDGFKPSPAGQTQLDTSREEETSRILKKDEGFKDSTLIEFERVSNRNLNSYHENHKTIHKIKEIKNQDHMYEKEEIKNRDDKSDNQKNKNLENTFERQESKNHENAYERDEIRSVVYVQGSFHQGDPMFLGNAGTQCVPNCLAGLSYHKVKNSKYWNTMDMNKILVTGDELYTYLQRSSAINNRYLLVQELPHFFECFDRSFEFRTNETLSSVILPGNGFNFAEFGAYSLDEALGIALAETDGCFVCFGGSTLLIGKSGDSFFSFDSHSRSLRGLLSVRGKSSRVLFQNVAQVHLHIHSLAISMGYSRDVECNVTGVHCKVDDILDARINAKQTREHVDYFVEETTDNSFSQKESSTECENDELAFVSIECEQFFYVPIDSVMKRDLCQDLNIPLICSGNGVDTYCSGKKLDKPSSQQEILGDGNCFFRAVSFSLTNSEDYHYVIRSAVCKHLLENEVVFKPFLRTGENTVKEHLSKSSMSKNGTWATELEILAVCHLINVDIYTYTRNQWLKFSIEKESPHIKRRTGAIYLNHHAQNHYNVVLDVCEKNVDMTEETVCESRTFDPKYSKKKMKNRQRMQAKRRVSSRIMERQNTVEKRKQSMRRKYQEDAEFRKKKLKAAYIKYKDDDEFHSVVKTRNRERYEKDALYRSKTKNRRQKEYAENEENRKKTKEASLKKYASSKAHQENVKNRSIKKYWTDAVHKKNVKARSVQKYKTNLVHKENVKQRSAEKYRTDTAHKKDLKQRSKEKYRTDIVYRGKVKKRAIERYKNDEMYREKIKKSNTEKYRTDEKYRKQVNFTKRYKTNKNFRDRILKSKARLYSTDDSFRSSVKACSKKQYYSSSDAKILKKKAVKQQRAAKRIKLETEEKVLELFKENALKGIDFVCCCCHRLLFANQVQKCDHQLYCNNERSRHVADMCIQEKYLHNCTASCPEGCTRSELWICYTCHRKMLSGNIPAEAAVNEMYLEDIPEELANLNSLEQHLIALHIPFMKVMALPQGGQRNIHGPVVCVPSDLKKATSLPLKHGDDLLLRVKLKRKLSYKGYFEYQFVNPSHIFTALSYLKKSNQWYESIEINNNWDGDSNEDEEVKVNHNMTVDDIDEHHQIAIDTCLQPADIAQEVLDHYFDDIYNIAPGEGKNPVRMLQEPGNEAKAFPCHFPSGKFTWNEDRGTRITLSRYFNNRLMNADGRFAKDSNYIFFCQFMSELNQVIEKTQISVRKSFSKMGSEKLVTSSMLQDPEILSRLLRNDEALRFMQPIRGTPAYWSTAQKDLFAMLRQLGIPTWFCSFSAAEHRWNDAVRTIMRQENDDRDPEMLDWSEKNETLRKNPVTVARMFEHRFHVFHRDVLSSPSEPIGKIVDYFQRVEFQQRGSPHMHCLYWIENAPKLDEHGKEAVCDFIDKYVSCELPSENEDPELRNIVLAVQQHSRRHSKSCRKKGTECRFNFPRPPSLRTFISSPCENDNDSALNGEENTDTKSTKSIAKDILLRVWEEVQNDSNEFKSLEEIFSNLSLSQEQYEEVHNMLTKSRSIVLRRNPCEMWINQYNPCLLKCWDANMDIQFVLDPFSCIVYIISYISKSEREMGMLLKQTKVEAEEGNLDARETLKKIGSAYLHHREVSAQEGVYRVCNLKMKECSRKVVFVPVGENPTRLSKPLSQLKGHKGEVHENGNEEDDDENEIWMTNIIERYENRPNKPLFHGMCLAEFCSIFRVLAKSQIPKTQNENVFELQNSKGYIQKRTRTKPAVIRYPRFSVEKMPEKYFRSLLQLFLPHWNEAQLKPPGFDLYEGFYETGHIRIKGKRSVQSVKSIVDINHAQYAENEDVITEAQETFENIGEPEDAWASLCPESELIRQECSVEKDKMHSLDEHIPEVIPDIQSQKNSDVLFEIQQKNHSKDNILPVLQSLNEKQKEVFYHVRDWCLRKIAGEKPDPLHVFITGGAGTGKSHVIKAVEYEASRLFSRIMSSPDGISVLLTAFTGTAAFNIGGNTIHHVFSLTKYLPLPYQPLKEQSLSEIRVHLQDLQILVIDEVSMVYKKLLYYIHERLVQIKKCKEPFGGVSIIAVGDFYQLPPVKQRKDERLFKENASYPVDYWRDFFKVVELNEIMRQQQDIPFATALNSLRIREADQPLASEAQSMIHECIREGPEDVLHVYPTNEEVNNYNLSMLRKNCEDLVEIEAKDFQKNATTGKLILREKPFRSSKKDNLCSSLLMAVNARVMLTRNCNVEDGLVNGVMGYISHFQCEKNSSNIIAIGVVFDNKTVGNKTGKRTEKGNVVLVQRVQEEIIEKKLKTVVRHQFPLRLSWACTAHKVQGMTVEKVVVNLDRMFSPGQAYVALTRVTSKKGLLIETNKKQELQRKVYADSEVKTALAEMPRVKLSKYSIKPSDKTIIFHNVQSLNGHFSDLQHDIRFREAEIICLTETWLRPDQCTTEFDLGGFAFHHTPRRDVYDESNAQVQKLRVSKGGGVALYTKQSQNKKLVSQLPEKNIESMAVKLIENDITVVTVYRPSTLSMSYFLERLQKLVEHFRLSTKHLIFVGDFNEDAKCVGPIQTLLNKEGFRQLVKFYTTESGTILDHVYVSGALQVEVMRLPTYYSYHDALAMTIVTATSFP
ncbi:uncharacterized protein LOC133199982 [Saccostrea echinata]|uniref:uncharacterized protein LOC133199982 n=1 Tax=Saccostrea echinata TaxID=191078 RepID=UPI002A81E8F9|nr:uncharacterized protein LOC133199982 [Saccostrea echinata]